MYISPLVTAIEGLGDTLEEPATSSVVDSVGGSIEMTGKSFTGEHPPPLPAAASGCPYAFSSNTTAIQENI